MASATTIDTSSTHEDRPPPSSSSKNENDLMVESADDLRAPGTSRTLPEVVVAEEQQDIPVIPATRPTDNCSKWRIYIAYEFSRSSHKCNLDFRNPQTGESILPTRIVVDLLRDVRIAARAYHTYLLLAKGIMLLSIYIALYIIPYYSYSMTNGEFLYILFTICMGVLYWYVWSEVIQRINVHNRMEKVVEKHQATFMEYGVKLGYKPSCSHLWLKRYPEQQLSDVENTNIINETEQVEHEPQQKQQYPPIFNNSIVLPGDISISEKHYDPSMVLEQEVWTLIQKAHVVQMNQPYTIIFSYCLLHFIWLSLVFFVLPFVILAWYASIPLFPVFLYLRNFEACLGCVGMWMVYFLAIYIADKWRIRACHQVARDVTSMLLQSDNHNLRGTKLLFLTSPLPNRTRSISHRYQLLRALPTVVPHDPTS